MKPTKKQVTHHHAEEQQAQTHQADSQATAREFNSVEELLREDAQQTVVPTAIVQRLQQSVSELPESARRAWWRRIFGASDR